MWRSAVRFILIAGLTASASAQTMFDPKVDYDVGEGPRSVFAIDLDGDGDSDLVTANASSDNVSVLLNNGDGTFPSAVNYAVGDYPYAVFSIDLDGDSDNDLATADYESDIVSILMNSGNGTFQPASQYYTCVDYNPSVQNYPNSVFSGDFDGDGANDLAMAHYVHYDDARPVGILINNGNGTFQAPAGVGAGYPYAWSVFCSDLDGDDDKDFVAAYDADVVCVFLNDGDGVFEYGSIAIAGNSPRSVFLIDVDGDSDDDLVVANQDSDNISVLLNDGSASFQPAINYSIWPLEGWGEHPVSVYSSDLDGDGDYDLASANSISGNVSILLNNGEGGFGSAAVFGVGSNPRSVFLADLDGDGFDDLMVANANSDNVSVLINATIQSTCCIGEQRGDVNLSSTDPPDLPTIGDISAMVDAKFISSTCGVKPGETDPVIRCLDEADVNASAPAETTCDDITIGDISLLVDYLFITGPTSWDDSKGDDFNGYFPTGEGKLRPCP